MRVTPKKIQSGSVLIETLVALLLFSVGVLSVVTMQAASVTFAGQAKYRSDAAFLAEQIVGQMWADKRSNLPLYAHRISGGACASSGAASTRANVISWLGASTKAGTVFGTLPGAADPYYQIIVGANKLVQVTVCWKAPKDAVAHNYVLVTQIDGGI